MFVKTKKRERISKKKRLTQFVSKQALHFKIPIPQKSKDEREALKELQSDT